MTIYLYIDAKKKKKLNVNRFEHVSGGCDTRTVSHLLYDHHQVVYAIAQWFLFDCSLVCFYFYEDNFTMRAKNNHRRQRHQQSRVEAMVARNSHMLIVVDIDSTILCCENFHDYELQLASVSYSAT